MTTQETLKPFAVWTNFTQLLRRGWAFAMVWALLVAVEAGVLWTILQWIDAISGAHEQQDQVIGAVFVLFFFEMPLLLVFGVFVLIVVGVSTASRVVFWPAMGDLLRDGGRTTLRNSISLSRWFIVLGVSGLLVVLVALSGCCTPWSALLLTPLVAAPYFAGREKSVSEGFKKSAHSFIAHPLLTLSVSLALALGWLLPEYIVVTGGQEFQQVLGTDIPEFTLRVGAAVGGALLGFLAWIFAGAVFATVETTAGDETY